MTLRERKKALTRSAIEDAGLRLFSERGYDHTTLDELCDVVLVSRRTFFRYFASKEEVLLTRLRDSLTQAAEHLRRRPPTEPLLDSLAAQFDAAAALYAADPDRELLRWRLVTGTPSLSGTHLRVLTDFERMVREWVADRTGDPASSPQVRLVAAAAATAFRVAVEIWADSDATQPLGPLARGNLEQLLAGTR